MTMHHLRPAIGLLLACAAGSALAADYITLSKRDGNHFVLGKEPAIRIGNAAMVRVLTHFSGSREISAGHHLLACDGSWMTDNFAYLSKPGGPADFAALERESSATMPEVIEADHHFTLQDKDGSYDGPELKRHIRRLCAQARPARPDMLVPVGTVVGHPDQLLVISIVARPVKAGGNRVRAWFRTTWYTQQQTVGRQPDPGVPTGEYEMTLKEMDCAKPQFTEIERIVHRPSGTQRTVCQAGRSASCAAIPVQEYTMGDEERKMACRLFGKPGIYPPL